MGFISVGIEAVRSTLKDVWKDYIYCDALDNDTLVTKGLNRNSSNGNVLSDQSKVLVSDGQCLLVVENGKIIDLVAEPGEYIYDKNAEPSIFLGGFKSALSSVLVKSVVVLVMAVKQGRISGFISLIQKK